MEDDFKGEVRRQMVQVEFLACSQNFMAASFLVWCSLAEDDREEMTWLWSLFTLYAPAFLRGV